MSVDFAARALALRAGQAQAFTTLATGIAGVEIPASVGVIQTSGYAVLGIGGAAYVRDTLATPELAAAHPRFCKADAGGRHWRLLPDDNGLIPVVCGGTNGIERVPATYQGIEKFAGYDAGGDFVLANGSISAGTGNDVVFTATGINFIIGFREEIGQRTVRAVVKAGTAGCFYLWMNSNSADPDQLIGCWFDLASDTISFDAIGTGSIASLGGGYYQVEVSGTTLKNVGFGISDAPGTVCTSGVDATMRSFSVAGTEGFDPWSAIDHQPGIQAAIDYCEAIGAAGTRYDARHYSAWRKARNPADPFDPVNYPTGLLLRTSRSHRFVSSCSGSKVWRRDTDGSPMGIAKFDTCTGSGGYYWRGGGIFTRGLAASPDNVSENSIYLCDFMLDGGITDSSEKDNPYGAFMHSSGDGWDISDKGIWQHNDHFCGDIVLEGCSSIRYFMGELVYSAGVGPGIARRKIRIGPDVELGNTCGSCLNGNGHTLEVDRCHLHDGFIGVEGWTGELGGYFNARISDTNRNSLQGGIPNFGAGSYFSMARPTASIVPVGQVDLVLNRAGQFDIGSWISGKIVSVDCYPSLGNGTAFPDGSREVDLHCVTVCDQGPLVGGIAILGGASGSKATDRVSVRLDCKQTGNAIANGYQFAQAVYCYGSFGEEVAVWLGAQEGLAHSPLAPAGTVHDNPIKVLDWNFDTFAMPYYYYDIEANHGATIDIKAYGNVVATQCSSNGSYTMNLPSTGVPAGYRLFVRDTTKNFIAGGGACRIPAGNFRAGRDVIVPPGFGYTELEFDGQAWSVVTPPPKLSATLAWDPASIAAGATETTSVTLVGALPGDEVTAGLSVDLQGMVLNAHVSAANTVTAVLFNPTGAAVDLASGTLRVTAG